jgi:tetratricopeptide (TPR) repeat protein
VGDRATLVADATESTGAHEAYLRGRYFWSQRTIASLQSAITEFQRAVELDPNYAEAWSGLADSYLVLPSRLDFPDWAEVLSRAVPAAERAVALAPDLGMSHASLGYAYTLSARWQEAEREFRRAIQLNPGYATTHGWYAILLICTGRADEAVVEATAGVALDPVSPAVNSQLGLALKAAGRGEESIDQYRKASALQPTASSPYLILGGLLLQAGEYDEAMEVALTHARLAGRDTVLVRGAVGAAVRYHETGEPQPFAVPEGMRMLGAGLLAYYALTGQRDVALQAFARLVRGPADWTAALTDAMYTRDLLADDPRYQALLEEAGITW